ncbi:MAG: hypothetical protein Q7T50_01330, partial [Candidatus Magasanikbacteria bacterium]|nr:hypothetical protein [Candidatus Magasanikbacteria bacterium]
CTLTYCGDGFIQNPNGRGTLGYLGVGDEYCDNAGSNNRNAVCDIDCSYTDCGDGVVQPQNGTGLGGISGTGDEECEIALGPRAGFECNSCRWECIPCTFDATTFDYCCFN